MIGGENHLLKQQSATHWEELRRHARQIENEIDSKLLSFGKIASTHREDDSSSSQDTVPLIGAANDGFERMSSEIESLLSQLTDINNRMSQYLQQIENPTAMYTFQRHREILSDYSNEFRKTRGDIQAKLDREQLMGSIKKDIDYKSSSNPNRKTDLYMKEGEHIRSSEIMIDEQINVATRTRESLLNQRNAFKAIQTQMTTLANRFPMINSLIHRINLRRRKESIILGCVIAICLTLIILYIF